MGLEACDNAIAVVEGDYLRIRVRLTDLPEIVARTEAVGEVRVTNPAEFARDMTLFLNREREDGSTPVHILLARAIVDAVESGSLGCELRGEM